jgi:hypothetical protein
MVNMVAVAGSSGRRGDSLKWDGNGLSIAWRREGSPSHTLFATSFDDKQRQLTMDVQW